jgi:hypothetical protein
MHTCFCLQEKKGKADEVRIKELEVEVAALREAREKDKVQRAAVEEALQKVLHLLAVPCTYSP